MNKKIELIGSFSNLETKQALSAMVDQVISTSQPDTIYLIELSSKAKDSFYKQAEHIYQILRDRRADNFLILPSDLVSIKEVKVTYQDESQG